MSCIWSTNFRFEAEISGPTDHHFHAEPRHIIGASTFAQVKLYFQVIPLLKYYY